MALRCRECGVQGEVVPLHDVNVNGNPLSAASLLPRCGCFLRGHRGKLPPAITNLLAGLPELPKQLMPREQDVSGEPAIPTSLEGSAGEGIPRRLTHSAKQLSSREVMVYLSRCKEEALLGSIIVTADHKLSDVAAMLRDELDVVANAEMYRGTVGQQLRVPLHKRQLKRPALPFFPCEGHHLLVEEPGE